MRRHGRSCGARDVSTSPAVVHANVVEVYTISAALTAAAQAGTRQKSTALLLLSIAVFSPPAGRSCELCRWPFVVQGLHARRQLCPQICRCENVPIMSRTCFNSIHVLVT